MGRERLLSELKKDYLLSRWSVIILMNMTDGHLLSDLVLGCMRKAIEERRNLKVVLWIQGRAGGQVGKRL